jgi:dCTP deaminase
LTEEIVTIPHNKIGFISIRAGSKFRGLANVSGFHVDPGYQGRLIFSVHNVGPTPMQLQRGEQLFLLWVADLDDSAKIEDAKNGAPRLEISTKLINSVAGEIHSLQSLATMVRKTERELSDKINEVDKKTSGRVYLLGMLGTLLVALVIFLLRGPIADEIGRLSVRASGQASEATVDGAGESPTSSQQE